ncbi:ComF family protein [Acidocella sp.]|uniref:ComF family protein n=1 Tax=Acidocella sp. TaxID=50710 RepID=UPI002637AB97|nr:ComF family protein [Acidocella sp.]
MKPLFRWLLDTVLPPSCLACDTPVEKEGQFCVTCFKSANFVSAPLCRCCGVPLPYAEAGGGVRKCPSCIATAPAFTQARAALRYDETAKRMILPLKYADHTEAVKGLAELMRRPGEPLLQAANLLVPVPLHATRLRARRFNQAALLAIQLARLTGRPVGVDLLVRRRETMPLEGLDLAARRAELEGAIAMRPDGDVRGKRVLLIDDVMTSGTTANECARVMLEAGARRVDVLTAARVADPRFEALALA